MSTRLCLLFLVGCATDAPPAAPTNVSITLLGAGAHVTWVDNSSDENEFVILRMQVGTDSQLRELARVPFNTTAYHDEPITAGATYMYAVHASNAAGEAASTTATFVAP